MPPHLGIPLASNTVPALGLWFCLNPDAQPSAHHGPSAGPVSGMVLAALAGYTVSHLTLGFPSVATNEILVPLSL